MIRYLQIKLYLLIFICNNFCYSQIVNINSHDSLVRFSVESYISWMEQKTGSKYKHRFFLPTTENTYHIDEILYGLGFKDFSVKDKQLKEIPTYIKLLGLHLNKNELCYKISVFGAIKKRKSWNSIYSGTYKVYFKYDCKTTYLTYLRQEFISY